jgi:5-formyltetrahydrofolate cyclo-ligase
MSGEPERAPQPAPAETVPATKRELRRELLARRRAMSDATVEGASRAVVATLRRLPELAGHHRVLLYAADPDEISVDTLVDDPPDGWTVLLPRVVDGEVVVVPHVPGAPLTAGFRGIREPSGPPLDAVSTSTTIDAVIVPGVAFTAAGARLGRGAGMYDRLLPLLTAAVRIGVCMEPFVVSDLALDPHDAAVDVLVTDASVRRRDAVADTPPA